MFVLNWDTVDFPPPHLISRGYSTKTITSFFAIVAVVLTPLVLAISIFLPLNDANPPRHEGRLILTYFSIWDSIEFCPPAFLRKGILLLNAQSPEQSFFEERYHQ